jgi:hypothetical protein
VRKRELGYWECGRGQFGRCSAISRTWLEVVFGGGLVVELEGIGNCVDDRFRRREDSK